MKQITAKYQISKDIFETPFKKEDIIKDVHNRILGNIAYELEDLLNIEQEKFISFPYAEIHFETQFFITSKTEFQKLSDLLREIRYYITEQQFDKFRNILFNYEK
jgi:hypothetical protein